MVLDWSSRSKASSVDELIARKSYAQAVELIKGQLEQHGKNERLTLQLAHPLTLAGRKGEATAVLERLADDLAADGFATKAIAVLKKLQKLEPGRSGIDERLAALIELKAPPAVAAWVEFPDLFELQQPKTTDSQRRIVDTFRPYLEDRDWVSIDRGREIGFGVDGFTAVGPADRTPTELESNA